MVPSHIVLIPESKAVDQDHKDAKQGKFCWVKTRDGDIAYYDSDEFYVSGYWEGEIFYESEEREDELEHFDGDPTDAVDRVYLRPHVIFLDDDYLAAGEYGRGYWSFSDITPISETEVPPLLRRRLLWMQNGAGDVWERLKIQAEANVKRREREQAEDAADLDDEDQDIKEPALYVVIDRNMAVFYEDDFLWSVFAEDDGVLDWRNPSFVDYGFLPKETVEFLVEVENFLKKMAPTST